MGSSALVVPGITDPPTLEAIACREGLALAEDLLVSNLIIASDCKRVIDDIKQGNQGAYGSVITEIKLRSSDFTCHFVFESRSSNGEAHSLAKHALSLGAGRHTWLVNPYDPICIPPRVDYQQ